MDMKGTAIGGKLSNTEYRFLPTLRSKKRRRPVTMQVIWISDVLNSDPYYDWPKETYPKWDTSKIWPQEVRRMN